MKHCSFPENVKETQSFDHKFFRWMFTLQLLVETRDLSIVKDLFHLSPRASDITDVTLASNDIPVCKHFQTGYCKFGRSCKKQHVSESCLKADCNSKACLQRHPKQCKFFSQSGFCKFGDSCSYKHTSSKL